MQLGKPPSFLVRVPDRVQALHYHLRTSEDCAARRRRHKLRQRQRFGAEKLLRPRSTCQFQHQTETVCGGSAGITEYTHRSGGARNAISLAEAVTQQLATDSLC